MYVCVGIYRCRRKSAEKIEMNGRFVTSGNSARTFFFSSPRRACEILLDYYCYTLLTSSRESSRKKAGDRYFWKIERGFLFSVCCSYERARVQLEIAVSGIY